MGNVFNRTNNVFTNYLLFSVTSVAKNDFCKGLLLLMQEVYYLNAQNKRSG